ncbi:acyltransferase family protein [Shewanella sp. OMA3-2]|uniref:acyltransferase family protein n=1 Tax=Shewanella sp. OMA3-2 TaxID=2908650 RepID=UPI001F25EF00|nr:acyltransferase family protein [Shewanella sp. OMA3-2]UJF21949.1 acyltransferase family protein [Shewanella sp. OMA3-2]
MLNSIGNLKAIIKYYFVPDFEYMPSRRFDLDWLRVGAFGLLIFFHIGMLYVENWGFHFKSQYQWQGLEMVMLFVSPWRMAILWLVSGIAIKFLLVKVSVERFVFLRSVRILLPLLFGILVVVPPQLYIEMTQKSALDMSYWQFMIEFFAEDSVIFKEYQAGIWPHIDVNHLWYLRSLWQFSLLLVCLLPLLNANKTVQVLNWIFRLPGALAIGMATLPIFLLQLFWEPDTVRYPLGFAFMLYGYLIGWSPLFWSRVKEALPFLAKLTPLVLVSFVCFYQFMWLPQGDNAHYTWQLLGLLSYSLSRVMGALLLLSLAYHYLNVASSKLSYWSEGVYAFYILHQSIIIIAAYQLSQFDLGPAGPIIEPLAVIVITIVGCLLCYELIRRSTLLRPLFGMKQAKAYSKSVNKLGYVSAGILIFPLALSLLL